MFVEVPRGRAGAVQGWELPEEGRPPQVWRVAGSDVLNGGRCLRLEGRQQTDDWDKPRADRAAWRRLDRVWLSPRLGVAYRVERVLERRDPARLEPTHRSVARYELESPLQYPGALFEDRRKEILQTRALAEAAAPLLPEPGKHGPQPFKALLVRINHHLEYHPPTPYREALFQVKRRVEAGLRGESPPAFAGTITVHPVISPGRPAPDFALTDLVTRKTVGLHQLQGKPVLLVFFRPTSTTTTDLLPFAQRVQDSFGPKVAVLALAVSEDVEQARRLQGELGLTIPLLDGAKLLTGYAVENTPKLVVLDAFGLVRGSFVGWGRETPAAVIEELRRRLQPGQPARVGTGLQGPGTTVPEAVPSRSPR
jgi:peroxiredoxin